MGIDNIRSHWIDRIFKAFRIRTFPCGFVDRYIILQLLISMNLALHRTRWQLSSQYQCEMRSEKLDESIITCPTVKTIVAPACSVQRHAVSKYEGSSYSFMANSH